MADLNVLAQWLTRLADELELTDPDSSGFDFDHQQLKTLLDVAREAAHEVDRPAAPLTTFLLGVAVGRGADLDQVAAQTVRLAHTPADD